MTPEAKARVNIGRILTSVGYVLQNTLPETLECLWNYVKSSSNTVTTC
jgi:hypothetical protein